MFGASGVECNVRPSANRARLQFPPDERDVVEKQVPISTVAGENSPFARLHSSSIRGEFVPDHLAFPRGKWDRATGHFRNERDRDVEIFAGSSVRFSSLRFRRRYRPTKEGGSARNVTREILGERGLRERGSRLRCSSLVEENDGTRRERGGGRREEQRGEAATRGREDPWSETGWNARYI